MLDILTAQLDGAGLYTELRHHANFHTRISLRQGNVIQNLSTRESGVSARCYRDGAFGFGSVAGDDEEHIRLALSNAADNTELSRPTRPANTGALPDAGAGEGSFDYRSAKPPLSAEDCMDMMQDIDHYVAQRYPGLLSRDLVVASFTSEKTLATTQGAKTYSYVPRATMYLSFSVQSNDGVIELHDTVGGFGERQEHFSDTESIYAAIDLLYEEVRQKAEGTYCDSGEFDVVLDSAVAGILAHEAIGHTCEADLVLGGSIAGDRFGQKVASEKITLVDYASRGPDGEGGIAIHVDDEGTPCRDVTLIDKGVLSGYLTSKETARDLDLLPTGNARAYNFSDEPLVRMRNTVIQTGQDTLEEMIGAVDRGYYLTRSLNGQADAPSEFMFGIACGYEIVDGTIKRAIRDTTISGVAFDMLQTVTHVGDKLTWMHGGWCGKKPDYRSWYGWSRHQVPGHGGWSLMAAEFASKVLRRALDLGAQEAEVEHRAIEYFEINFESGTVNLLRTNIGRETDVTLFKSGRKGAANFSGTQEVAIEESLASAMTACRSGPPDEANGVADAACQPTCEHGTRTPDRSAMLETTKRHVTMMSERYPSIRTRSSVYSHTATERSFANSRGTTQGERRSNYRVSMMFAGRTSEEVTSFNYAGAASFEPFESLLLAGNLEGLLQDTLRSFAPQPVPHKLVGDVIISPHCMMQFMGNVAGALDGYALLAGTSPYINRLGEAVASEGFSLESHPRSPQFPGGADFDRQGVPTHDIGLIKNGKLASYLVDFYTANKLGREQTAGKTNLVVATGERSLEEIISETEEGILLSRFSGARPN